MNNEIYYICFFSLLAVYAFCFNFSLRKMRSFSSITREISSLSDIENFKNMAKQQMYLAYISIAFAGTAVLLFLYHSYMGLWSIRDTVILILVVAVNMKYTKMVKSMETEISKIPATNEDLARMRDHIVHVWHKKFLPKF